MDAIAYENKCTILREDLISDDPIMEKYFPLDTAYQTVLQSYLSYSRNMGIIPCVIVH